MGRDGEYHDNYYGPPRPTTGEKIIKAAKIAGAVAAPVLVVGGAVTYVPPIHDAAVGIVEGVKDKLGVQVHAERDEDWKEAVVKQNATPLAQPTQIPLSEFTQTPTPEPTKSIEDTTMYVGELTVGDFTYYIDKEGLPIKYKDKSGKQTFYTDTERQEMKQAQQQAIDSKSPKIFKTVRIEEKSDDHVEKPGHPVLNELPADVLSEAELQKKNVTIVQNTEKPVFFIRESAFDKGMPLEDYKDGTYKLRYFILDAPFLSDALMPNTPEWQIAKNIFLGKGTLGVKGETVLDTAEFKKNQLLAHQNEIEEYEEKIKNSTGGERALQEHVLILRKAELALFEKLSDEDWRRFEISTHYNSLDNPGGVYSKSFDTTTIIFAVGSKWNAPAARVYAFDSTGNFTTLNTHAYLSRGGLKPQGDQSFPDPDTYPRNKDAKWPNDYLIGGVTPGFVNAHETCHYKLIGHVQNTIDDHDPKYTKANGDFDGTKYFKDFMGNRSEYDTDACALAYMDQAWIQYKTTGKDSRYGFVFRLEDGRYIVTEKTEPTPKNTTAWLQDEFFPEQQATTHARKTMNPDTVVELIKTEPPEIAPPKLNETVYKTVVNGEPVTVTIPNSTPLYAPNTRAVV